MVGFDLFFYLLGVTTACVAGALAFGVAIGWIDFKVRIGREGED